MIPKINATVVITFKGVVVLTGANQQEEKDGYDFYGE
jgi:hypothetical protein